MKRDLAREGGELRTRAKYGGGGLETVGGDGGETGYVTKKNGKQKSTTGTSVSLTPDYRDKEESNNDITRTDFPLEFS